MFLFIVLIVFIFVDAITEFDKYLVISKDICDVVFDLRNPSLSKLKSMFIDDIKDCTLVRLIPCSNGSGKLKAAINYTDSGAILVVAADQKHVSYYFYGIVMKFAYARKHGYPLYIYRGGRIKLPKFFPIQYYKIPALYR